MTVTVRPPANTSELLAQLATRVSRLERRSGGTAYTDGGVAKFPGGIDTGGTGDVSTTSATPDPPTNLAAAPGALFDEIYADVTWDPPADTTGLAGYELRLDEIDDPGGAGETASIVDVFVLPIIEETRLGGLTPNTTYDVTLASRNAVGAISTPATVRFTTGADNTTPAQVTGLVLTSGVTTVVGVWDEVADGDVANGRGLYELEVDTVATFDSGAQRSTRVGGTIASIGDLVAGQTYYGRVRAIDQSGNAGPWSATATADGGLVETATIANAAIVTAHIGDAQVTDAKIVSASIDKLTAGTLDVIGTITAGGGIYVGSGPGATGLYLDDSGIRAYSGATRTVFIDAATGDAELTGVITATGGSITGSVAITGTVTAAGGAVTIDADGLTLEQGSSAQNGIDWIDSAASEAVRARIYHDGTNLNLVANLGKILLAPDAGSRVEIGSSILGADLRVFGSVDAGSGEIVTSGFLTGGHGTASDPGWRFSGDLNTGIYRSAANVLGIAAGGVPSLLVDANDVRVVQRTLILPNGSTSLPAVRFFNDGDTGVRLAGTGAVELVRAGGRGLYVASTIITGIGDGQHTLGNSSNRFGQIWSTSSTISTSDPRMKRDVRPIPGDEASDLVRRLADAVIEYRWRDGGTRPHHGLDADHVGRVLDELGRDHAAYVDPSLTSDEELERDVAVALADRLADATDDEIDDARDAILSAPKGLRYEELIPDLIAAFAHLAAEIDRLRPARP